MLPPFMPGIAVSFFTILMLIVRFCIEKLVVERQQFQLYFFKNFVNFIIVGITILVVAVPEGLPLAVTLSLAYSVKVFCSFHTAVTSALYGL